MPLQVNQLGVYGGFIGNYQDAVEVVRRSSQSDIRFRLLAEVTLTVYTPLTLVKAVQLTITSQRLLCAEHDAQQQQQQL